MVIPVTTHVVSYSSCRFCSCETNTGPFSMKQNVVSMEGVGKNDIAAIATIIAVAGTQLTDDD